MVLRAASGPELMGYAKQIYGYDSIHCSRLCWCGLQISRSKRSWTLLSLREVHSTGQGIQSYSSRL